MGGIGDHYRFSPSHELRFLINEIIWRIKAGATVKISTVEIGAPYVRARELQKTSPEIAIREDSDGEFKIHESPLV